MENEYSEEDIIKLEKKSEKRRESIEVQRKRVYEREF